MAVTKDQVREKLNASQVSAPDAVIDTAISVVKTLVTKAIGDNDVPTVIVDEAILAAAVEKIHIDQAPGGIVNQQYDIGVDGAPAPIRVGRDPMKAAYPLLDPFISGRFFCA